ncbi:hypothetical protein [Oceanisphaera avium]|uniref:Uncharacterized protein n=1 Tax=Oceanisphaera avium TaxID=1903694 RepID=A0A1Y0CYG0_9GAMM|nr:hypothetical protein [Oceanisphaera avium]ART79926.1 hypothetical protein CBP12_06990 [Oceanisphaera avium]
MLARERRYTLLSGADFYVNVKVHPCCTIEIDIPEQRQYFRPTLEQLHFKLTSQGMQLVIDQHEEELQKELHFSREDAMALCKMINEVVEEHEDLMSSLC